MFCQHCGTQLAEGAVFCHLCGVRQTPPRSTIYPSGRQPACTVPQPHSATTVTSPKGKVWKSTGLSWFILCAALVLGLLLDVLGAVFWYAVITDAPAPLPEEVPPAYVQSESPPDAASQRLRPTDRSPQSDEVPDYPPESTHLHQQQTALAVVIVIIVLLALRRITLITTGILALKKRSIAAAIIYTGISFFSGAVFDWAASLWLLYVCDKHAKARSLPHMS